MKSEIITIDNRENGFSDAVKEARKVAVYTELNPKDSLHLQLCTEELMSLVRSITGEIKASFWIETKGSQYDLHVSTKTAMDMEKRNLLLSVATSRKNEAAKSFIGMLRDVFEETMVVEVKQGNNIPAEVMGDVVNRVIVCTDAEWDGYEQSTLKKLADVIKVSIRGGAVDLTVSKKFA
ncbi:MAG: hypothetical protein IKH57_20905 [Clostridia bacterium]|nr:hypothetical protein [Clostridia bacterium]